MKDLINPNLDLTNLQKSFKEKGYVVIDNYLKDEVANDLNNFFSYEMPSDWWSIATFPSLNKEGVSYFRNTHDEYDNIKRARQYSTDSFGENLFSYSFHRTLENHFTDCECTECSMRKFLDGKKSHDLVSKITDLSITGSNEVFAACYMPGDFLSPHQDSPNGIIGFVLQLTSHVNPGTPEIRISLTGWYRN